MNHDVVIERHRVIQAGKENGWRRCAAPSFDLWQRGDREVQVFYCDDGSVNSAQCVDHRSVTAEAVTTPEGLVSQVLQWLQTP